MPPGLERVKDRRLEHKSSGAHQRLARIGRRLFDDANHAPGLIHVQHAKAARVRHPRPQHSVSRLCQSLEVVAVQEVVTVK